MGRKPPVKRSIETPFGVFAPICDEEFSAAGVDGPAIRFPDLRIDADVRAFPCDGTVAGRSCGNVRSAE